jgi:hypothetical protein
MVCVQQDMNWNGNGLQGAMTKPFSFLFFYEHGDDDDESLGEKSTNKMTDFVEC